jgi:Na+/proline symporter
MYLIDWILVALPLLVVGGVTIYANRFLKSVADFTSGGRLAGRYLLSTARSEMGAGAIGYVAMFEWFSHGGFPVTCGIKLPVLSLLSWPLRGSWSIATAKRGHSHWLNFSRCDTASVSA